MVTAITVGTNSYITQAEADTELGDNISTGGWAFLGTEAKSQSLITAFSLLETQSWQGSKTGGAVQTAQHPRTGLSNCNGDAISSVTTAPDIKSAQALLAFELSQDPKLAGNANTGSNIKKLQAGSASIEFHQRTDDDGSPTSRFPSRVQELIACYLKGGTGTNEAFGTTSNSIFEDCDKFDRNQPFS